MTSGYVFGFALPGQPYIKYGSWLTLEETLHHADHIMEECAREALSIGELEVVINIATGAELLSQMTVEKLNEATLADRLTTWHAAPFIFVIAEYENIVWDEFNRMTTGGDHRTCGLPENNRCQKLPKFEDQPDYPTDDELFKRIEVSKEEMTEEEMIQHDVAVNIFETGD